MPQTLEIHHLNVEQGESTLLAIDDNGTLTTLLIDGGLQGQGVAIEKYFTALFGPNRQLDYVLISHFDEDHWEGIKWLIGRNTIIGAQTRFYTPPKSFDVFLLPLLCKKGLLRIDKFKLFRAYLKGGTNRANQMLLKAVKNFEKNRKAPEKRLWSLAEKPIDINPAVFPDGYRDQLADYNDLVTGVFGNALQISTQDLVNALQAGRIFEKKAKRTPVLITAGNVQLDLLYYGTYDSNHNNDSLAWLLRFHNFRYYTGGDLKSELEDALFYTNEDDAQPGARKAEKIHVFKAGHHGSHKSTSDTFLQMIRPDACIVSCGNPVSGSNTFDHPRSDLMKRLLKHNVSTFVTNLITNTLLQLPDSFRQYSWFNVRTGNIKFFNDGSVLQSNEPQLFYWNVHRAARSIDCGQRPRIGYTFNNKTYYCRSQNPYEVDFIIDKMGSAQLNRSLVQVANPIESYLAHSESATDSKTNYFIGEDDKNIRMQQHSVVLRVNESGALKLSPEYGIRCGTGRWCVFPRTVSQPSQQSLLPALRVRPRKEPAERKRKSEQLDPEFETRDSKRLRETKS